MGFKFKRKGQSATEYLMTYGWALLAIAVVGGLLYMYVFSNNECTQVVKGFSSPGISILGAPNYVLHSNGDLTFIIQNKLNQNVTITAIDADGHAITPPSGQIAPSQTVQVSGNIGPSNVGTCKEVKLTITYNIQGGMSGAEASGSLIAKVVK